ncbi:MAG TPA: cupin domain-containing protein [Actinomycetota bacterium]|nr:cupin domain-containing protein [Actinomycetota bacterium]
MGTIAKLSTKGDARVESLPGFEGRYVEQDGYVLGLESFEQAADFTPMYRGLPDDLCQAHHWGYVIKGRMIFHRPEGDEAFEEGEAYYVGPGHTGEAALPGTKIVEFSPSDEYAQTMAVVAKNLEGSAS